MSNCPSSQSSEFVAEAELVAVPPPKPRKLQLPKIERDWRRPRSQRRIDFVPGWTLRASSLANGRASEGPVHVGQLMRDSDHTFAASLPPVRWSL